MTATRGWPSQWAAVRKTFGAISVPVHVAQVPSEYACGASSAPTSGWPLPSGTPYVMALLTATTASAATSVTSAVMVLVRMNPP